MGESVVATNREQPSSQQAVDSSHPSRQWSSKKQASTQRLKAQNHELLFKQNEPIFNHSFVINIPAQEDPSSLPVIPTACSETLGSYLARLLVEIGVHDVFFVPGDFNLMLLAT
ncbi:hypothetical protein ACFXTN_011116 [Malus domestica]